jgi:hypothetical protein
MFPLRPDSIDSVALSLLTTLLTSSGLIAWLWSERREAIIAKSDITKCNYGESFRTVIKATLPPVLLGFVQVGLFAGFHLIPVGLSAFWLSVTVRHSLLLVVTSVLTGMASPAGPGAAVDHALCPRARRPGDLGRKRETSHSSPTQHRRRSPSMRAEQLRKLSWLLFEVNGGRNIESRTTDIPSHFHALLPSAYAPSFLCITSLYVEYFDINKSTMPFVSNFSGFQVATSSWSKPQAPFTRSPSRCFDSCFASGFRIYLRSRRTS